MASAELASCFLAIQGACLSARWGHCLGLSHRLRTFCLTSGTPRSQAGHEPNHIRQPTSPDPACEGEAPRGAVEAQKGASPAARGHSTQAHTRSSWTSRAGTKVWGHTQPGGSSLSPLSEPWAGPSPFPGSSTPVLSLSSGFPVQRPEPEQMALAHQKACPSRWSARLRRQEALVPCAESPAPQRAQLRRAWRSWPPSRLGRGRAFPF